MDLPMALLAIVVFLQNIIFFDIVSKALEGKPNKKMAIILGIINTIIALIFVYILCPSMPIAYLLKTMLYCTQISICYKAKLIPKIAIALTIVLNTLCIDTMTMSMFSLNLQVPTLTILNNSQLFLWSRIIISFICVMISAILIKSVPDDSWQLSRDNVHKNLIFIALQAAAIISLLSNSLIYKTNYYIPQENLQQFIQGASWLVVEYIGVFMLIGFELMEEHKKVLAEEAFIKGFYKNILIDKSELTLEVNCATGEIIDWRVKQDINVNAIGSLYSDVILDIIHNQIHPDDREHILFVSDINYMLKQFDKGITKYSFEYRLTERDVLEYNWFRVDVRMTNNLELHLITSVLVIENIQAEKDLLFNAERDALSGLYNKITTQKLIQMHLHEPGILFMIDMDNFKTLNDTLGHDIGDIAIKDISTELTSIFKDTDIVGRIGGDEFMAFAKNTDEKLNLSDIIDELAYRLNKTYSDDTNTVTISASIGIVHTRQNITDFNDLYILADKAMYTSKAHGKNKATIYNDNMHLSCTS